MALNIANYTDKTAAEIHGIQRVYIEDYEGVKAELTVASEAYKSGSTDTALAFKRVEKLVRRKLAILNDINILGRLIDERDGTISTQR